MIQEKFNQYFHSKGFKFIQLRNGVVFEDETLADGSTRLKSKQYVEIKNENEEDVVVEDLTKMEALRKIIEELKGFDREDIQSLVNEMMKKEDEEDDEDEDEKSESTKADLLKKIAEHFKSEDEEVVKESLTAILEASKEDERILLQQSPIDGLLSPDVVKSKFKDEHWNPFSYSLEPIDERQASIKKKVIRMSDFYDFLVQKYEENKRGIFTLNEIILQSVAKYGMLTIGKYKEKVWTAHEYKVIDEYNNRDLNAWTNILKKRDEYKAWLFVFQSLIPSTLEYVSKNQYKLTQEMLNYRIRNIEVEFENIQNNKLKISPNDLMSALILYAKTKSLKKLPIVNCLYCDKPFKQKIGRGRPQKFCCPSHTNMYTLKQRMNKLKKT